MKNSVYSRFLYAVIPAALVLSMQASDTPANPGCDSHLYRAIDSRLEPHIVGLLPKTSQPVVGFEVVQDRPLVAFSHLLLGFKRDGVAELPVSQVLKGLSYEKNSDVLCSLMADSFDSPKRGWSRRIS
jgi:hypothetical protein